MDVRQADISDETAQRNVDVFEQSHAHVLRTSLRAIALRPVIGDVPCSPPAALWPSLAP